MLESKRGAISEVRSVGDPVEGKGNLGRRRQVFRQCSSRKTLPKRSKKPDAWADRQISALRVPMTLPSCSHFEV